MACAGEGYAEACKYISKRLECGNFGIMYVRRYHTATLFTRWWLILDLNISGKFSLILPGHNSFNFV